MKHPIQYALTYPERRPAKLAPLDLIRRGALTFEAVDREKFPCLGLAYRALACGSTAPVALNAANEVAVAGFLSHRLPFLGIAEIVEAVLEEHDAGAAASVEEVLAIDAASRARASRALERRAIC